MHSPYIAPFLLIFKVGALCVRGAPLCNLARWMVNQRTLQLTPHDRGLRMGVHRRHAQARHGDAAGSGGVAHELIADERINVGRLQCRGKEMAQRLGRGQVGELG